MGPDHVSRETDALVDGGQDLCSWTFLYFFNFSMLFGASRQVIIFYKKYFRL